MLRRKCHIFTQVSVDPEVLVDVCPLSLIIWDQKSWLFHLFFCFQLTDFFLKPHFFPHHPVKSRVTINTQYQHSILPASLLSTMRSINTPSFKHLQMTILKSFVIGMHKSPVLQPWILVSILTVWWTNATYFGFLSEEHSFSSNNFCIRVTLVL